MFKNVKKFSFYFLITALAITAVIAWRVAVNRKLPKESHAWSVILKHLGTLSSPRLADLNDDGFLDIVVGAGNVEFMPNDSAVLALDGANGKILWTAHARDQIFGSAVFKDITGDGIQDVFVGGRAAELKAINGKNGEIIWEYYTGEVNIAKSDSGAYNFYNPQFIPDQDNDGIEDLVIAAGGYVKALPHDPNRPAGKLLVLSSRSGARLASATIPDGKEIYMSVVVADFKDNGELSIIFGTGGETLGGGLYKASLSHLLMNDLSKSKLLISGDGKGFIAPPVLADITLDGIPDIIANAVNGRMVAIDGHSERLLWEVSIPGTEAYCSISAGYYTADNVPDFFTNYGIGIWPDLNRSVQFMVNGQTGEVLFRDSLGTFQESTPVTCDYNQDGFDDALFSVNYQNRSGYSNQLMVIDFENDTLYETGPRHYGANIASTPWVGDIDENGYLDIIYCNEINPFDLLSVTYKQGLKITKIKTEVSLLKPVQWGAYMGSFYDGIFRAGTTKNESY